MHLKTILPLLEEFCEVYDIAPATAQTYVAVATRCRNIIQEELDEAHDARLAYFSNRDTSSSSQIEARAHLAQEYGDVRYVTAYARVVLDLTSYRSGHRQSFLSLPYVIDNVFDQFDKITKADFNDPVPRTHLGYWLGVLDSKITADAIMLGIPLDRTIQIIHRANLNKVWPDGQIHRREDGKIIKPPEWVGPLEEIKKIVS